MSETEAEAIEGAKQGDVHCFQDLYARNKSRVYSLCLRMVGNVETAEDLAQEAFLQLHRKIVASVPASHSFTRRAKDCVMQWTLLAPKIPAR